MNEPVMADLPVKSLSKWLARRVLLLGVIGVVGLVSTAVLGFWITLYHAQARMDRVNLEAVGAFDQFFLDSVKRHGRLHEIEAILRYKLEKKNFFEDSKVGLGMFLKGRMGILPHNIKDRKQVKEIFARTEKK